MRVLDLGLYLASALLTATGLTWIKYDLAGLARPDLLTPDLLAPDLLALGRATLVRLAAAAVVYLAGMLLWLVVLGRNPMSTAYPIGIGLSLVSTTLAAIVVLGEPVGLLRLAGIAAILAGAVCIGRSP
jgi:multidrug transporter EmrE-like cation transporter